MGNFLGELWAARGKYGSAGLIWGAVGHLLSLGILGQLVREWRIGSVPLESNIHDTRTHIRGQEFAPLHLSIRISMNMSCPLSEDFD